ncbi:MAG: hypothetical protein MZV70_59110 [Desulfobacterales bacterium]|nr:hypothetical protein [Desulfobacterales bacterium]
MRSPSPSRGRWWPSCTRPIWRKSSARVSRDEGTHLFGDLDVEVAAEALSELKPEKQAEIINAIDPEKAADIIEEMPPDEAADVLSDLSAEKAKEVLDHIEKEEAEDIQELLGHEEDTAGGLMTNEFISYPPDITVREAIERFKRDAEEIETVYYLYVVDAQENSKGSFLSGAAAGRSFPEAFRDHGDETEDGAARDG